MGDSDEMVTNSTADNGGQSERTDRVQRSADPPEESQKERWGLALRLIFPAAKAARGCLSITEDVFRSHTFHSAPRQFFLWTALDEVLKTGLFLMKLDGLLEGEAPRRTSQDAGDPTERALEAMLLEEEHLRWRRLSELLSQLVLFCQKDEEPLYEHYLLLDELVAASSFNGDLAEFHGVRSEWIQSTVDMTVGQVRDLEAKVDFKDAWYAGYQPPVDPARSRQLLSSARKRLIRALPLMTNFERLALGTTYAEAFGRPSGTIHFRAGADPVDHASESAVVTEGTKLGMLALCALARCYELLGRPSVPQLEQISRLLTSNEKAGQLLELLNVRSRIAVGDVVLARGHLGQVMEERFSTYQYRSLRVEFLAERPLPSLTGDWFRARDVALLFSNDRLIEGVRAKLGDSSARVGNEVLREAALSAWNVGLREQVHRRHR